jgi:hypothetical protein
MILSTKEPKGGLINMEKEPAIHHMNQMLRQLPDGPFRAAYLVIEELYILQTGGKDNA